MAASGASRGDQITAAVSMATVLLDPEDGVTEMKVTLTMPKLVRKITPRNRPMLFRELEPALSATSLTVLDSMGLSLMTPVQTAAIPVLLGSNKDVIVQAHTGSGNTVAFVLPIVESLLFNREELTPGHVNCIIVTPTRELATQIYQVVAKFTSAVPGSRGMSCALLIGGKTVDSNIAECRRGCSIIVGTPGAVLRTLCHEHAPDLSSVQTVVLDDANHLLQFGFGSDLSSLLSMLPSWCRTCLAMTQMSEGVKAFAKENLRSPVTVTVQDRCVSAQTTAPGKFFTISALHSREAPRDCLLFTAWGRGSHGQQALEVYPSRAEVVEAFCAKFFAKTKNRWENRGTFKAVRGKYSLSAPPVRRVSQPAQTRAPATAPPTEEPGTRLVVKVQADEHVRRFSLPPRQVRWSAARKALLAVLGAAAYRSSLTFVDDEGDEVRVTRRAEFEDAVQQVRECGLRTLRFTAKPSKSPAFVEEPPSPPASPEPIGPASSASAGAGSGTVGADNAEACPQPTPVMRTVPVEGSTPPPRGVTQPRPRRAVRMPQPVSANAVPCGADDDESWVMVSRPRDPVRTPAEVTPSYVPAAVRSTYTPTSLAAAYSPSFVQAATYTPSSVCSDFDGTAPMEAVESYPTQARQVDAYVPASVHARGDSMDAAAINGGAEAAAVAAIVEAERYTPATVAAGEYRPTSARSAPAYAPPAYDEVAHARSASDAADRAVRAALERTDSFRVNQSRRDADEAARARRVSHEAARMAAQSLERRNSFRPNQAQAGYVPAATAAASYVPAAARRS